jgi:hypothetical protein
MNLYQIGKTIINVDRVNGIVDHVVPAGTDGPNRQAVLRILFDHGSVDLTGTEALVFRSWYRHASRRLERHHDEDGEELVSPDEQVRRSWEFLRGLVDRQHPRDPAMRQTVHRLGQIIDQFLTGELQPARASTFARSFPPDQT